jgi:hypothetical protein
VAPEASTLDGSAMEDQSAPDAPGDDGASADSTVDGTQDSSLEGETGSDAAGANASDATSASDATNGTVDGPAGDALADVADLGDATEEGDDAGDADAQEAGNVADAGPSFDASGIDAGALCAPFPIGNPVTYTYVDAAAPPTSVFTGGTLESGTYLLASSVSYTGAFGNATFGQSGIIIDLATSTFRNGHSDQGGSASYFGAGIVPGNPGGNSFQLVLLCPGVVGSASVVSYYTFTGSGPGATLTISEAGSDTVGVYTKQ